MESRNELRRLLVTSGLDISAYVDFYRQMRMDMYVAILIRRSYTVPSLVLCDCLDRSDRRESHKRFATR